MEHKYVGILKVNILLLDLSRLQTVVNINYVSKIEHWNTRVDLTSWLWNEKEILNEDEWIPTRIYW